VSRQALPEDNGGDVPEGDVVPAPASSGSGDNLPQARHRRRVLQNGLELLLRRPDRVGIRLGQGREQSGDVLDVRGADRGVDATRIGHFSMQLFI